MDISVIIPLFNEEESLPELFAWIKRVMDSNDFTYEVIFVNDVADPVAVRYGFSNSPRCNLYNEEGLPASPFRTDHWE